MATNYLSNDGRTNYARLCRAFIDLSADVLRDVLNRRTSPTDIRNEIRKNPDSIKLIRKDQLAYINNAAVVGSYLEFDVSLLCLVLRLLSVQDLRILLQSAIPVKDIQSAVHNCAGLTSNPSTKLSRQHIKDVQVAVTGSSYDHCKDELLWKLYTYLCQTPSRTLIHPSVPWGIARMPDSSHITLGDDVERIRILRNKAYGHVSTTEMSDSEFNSCWGILEDIMSRMDQRRTSTNYRASLDRIKTVCMDAATELRYCEEIRKMAEREKEILIEIQKMSNEIAEMKIKDDLRDADIDDVKKEIIETKTDVKKEIIETKTDLKIFKAETMQDKQKTSQLLSECISDKNNIKKTIGENTVSIKEVGSKVDGTKQEVQELKQKLEKGYLLTEGEGVEEHERVMLEKHTLLRIEKHKKDKTFVITNAVSKGKDILTDQGMLIYSGLPGQGKTTNALEIMKQLQVAHSEWKFIELDDVRKWKNIIDPDSHSVVLLNDVIAIRKSNIDRKLITDGDKHWPNILASVEMGKVKVIMTIRKNLLDQNLIKLEKYKVFDGRHTIDLTSDEYKLNEVSKRDIILRHCMNNNIEVCLDYFEENYKKIDINDEKAVIKVGYWTISNIVKTDPVIGFPFACYLFCCKRKYTQLGEKFFTKPTKYLIDEINSLMQPESSYTEKLQYCIMSYMMLQDGSFESLDEEMFNKVLQSVELPHKPTKRERKEAIQKLLDRYIVKGVNAQYEFKHQTILESVAVCFNEDNSDLLIELCSREFIVEFVRPQNFKQAEGEIVCKIDREVYQTLVKRFMFWLKLERDKTEYDWWIGHPLMDNKLFVDFLMDTIQSDEYDPMYKNLITEFITDIFFCACICGKTYFLDKLYTIFSPRGVAFKRHEMILYPTLVHGRISTAIWLLDHNFVTDIDMIWSLKLPHASVIKHPCVTLNHIVETLGSVCARCDSNVVKAILTRWPDLEQGYVLTMLEYFIFYGNSVECVDALIECRPDVITDAYLKTVFTLACKGLFNTSEMLDYWTNTKHTNVNYRTIHILNNEEKLTYLHIAAFFGRLDVCKKLVELGLQLDDRTKSGLNVLQMAVLGLCCRSVGAYVASVKYIGQESDSIYVAEKAAYIIQNRDTVLVNGLFHKLLTKHYNMVACSQIPLLKYRQLFEYIQNSTAISDTDFDITVDLFGSKFIHYCVLYGDLSMIEMLYNIDKRLVHALNADNMSGIHIAAFFGKLEIFMKLIAFGLNVSSRTAESRLSVLQLAMVGFTYQDLYAADIYRSQLLLYQSKTLESYCRYCDFVRCGTKASYEQIISLMFENKDFRATDLNIALDFYGNFLPEYCIVYNSLHIIQLLCKTCPRILSGEVVSKDKRFPFKKYRKMKPIQLSVLMGRREIFKQLLSCFEVDDKDIPDLIQLVVEGRKYVGFSLYLQAPKPDFLSFLPQGSGCVTFGNDEDYTLISQIIQSRKDSKSE